MPSFARRRSDGASRACRVSMDVQPGCHRFGGRKRAVLDHDGITDHGKPPCVSIWSTCNCSSPWPRRAASPAAPTRAHLALASASARIKGLEAALGVALLQARPPRHRADRGGRKPARSCPHHPAQCRGHARRSRGLRQRRQGQRSVCSPTPRGCRNICRRRWRPSSRDHPHQRRRRGARKRRHRPAIAAGAADLGLAAEHALPDTIERFAFSDDRLVLVAARGDELASRAAGRFSRSDRPRLRRPDRSASALQATSPDMPRGSARGCAFGRGCNDFHAICQMVAAGDRHRRGAGSRGQALRADRCRSAWCGFATPGPAASSRSAPAVSRRCRARRSNWWSICARRRSREDCQVLAMGRSPSCSAASSPLHARADRRRR